MLSAILNRLDGSKMTDGEEVFYLLCRRHPVALKEIGIALEKLQKENHDMIHSDLSRTILERRYMGS